MPALPCCQLCKKRKLGCCFWVCGATATLLYKQYLVTACVIISGGPVKSCICWNVVQLSLQERGGFVGDNLERC